MDPTLFALIFVPIGAFGVFKALRQLHRQGYRLGFYDTIFAVSWIGVYAGFMVGFHIPSSRAFGPVLFAALASALAITAITWLVRVGLFMAGFATAIARGYAQRARQS